MVSSSTTKTLIVPWCLGLLDQHRILSGFDGRELLASNHLCRRFGVARLELQLELGPQWARSSVITGKVTRIHDRIASWSVIRRVADHAQDFSTLLWILDHRTPDSTSVTCLHCAEGTLWLHPVAAANRIANGFGDDQEFFNRASSPVTVCPHSLQPFI